MAWNKGLDIERPMLLSCVQVMPLAHTHLASGRCRQEWCIAHAANADLMAASTFHRQLLQYRRKLRGTFGLLPQHAFEA